MGARPWHGAAIGRWTDVRVHVHSYRKAYITGMNPLTFLTWFTFGEITTVTWLP